MVSEGEVDLTRKKGVEADRDPSCACIEDSYTHAGVQQSIIMKETPTTYLLM